MPQLLEQPVKERDELRIQWTREDCDRLVQQGWLQSGKFELIEGDIIRKMGQKRPHAIAVTLLFAWCISVFGKWFVQTQASINVAPEDNPTSEPEPDVFVLHRSIDHFPEELPNPEDLALVIEVADTTLRFDLSNKAGLYARAGIAEYWVLDVIGRSLIVHQNPENGIYQQILRYAEGETLSPLAKPDALVLVSAFLPPLPTA
jgi:Uma2 family endonuclease